MGEILGSQNPPRKISFRELEEEIEIGIQELKENYSLKKYYELCGKNATYAKARGNKAMIYGEKLLEIKRRNNER